MNRQSYLHWRDLGDGLVLRWSGAEDAERAGVLAAAIFGSSQDDLPNERHFVRTRDLASGRHPLSSPQHGVVVEDTSAGKLVASMWIMSTTWEYDGIAFGVGRPEMVVCLPEYRRRGLVRALFDAFHSRSAAEGQLVQAITGIPYFYRQFGYEYAVPRDRGRTVRLDALPPPPAHGDAFQMRDATSADIPFIKGLYDRTRQGWLISAQVPPAYWRWLLFKSDPGAGLSQSAAIIHDARGEPCGYVLHAAQRYDASLRVLQIALAEHTSWVDALPAILRGLRVRAAAVPMRRESDDVVVQRLNLSLGAAHPAYAVLDPRLVEHVEPLYAWYVRVPDLAAFLNHIRPVLEDRLVRSPAAGYSGELLIDCFRYGVRIVFEQGHITTVEPWQHAIRPLTGPEPGAAFPPLVLLQLVFGFRDLDDLRYAYPDVRADSTATMLLKVLFPPRPSHPMEMN